MAHPYKEVLLLASGDLRLAANQNCWPAQHAMETQLTAALAKQGYAVRRAHPYDPAKAHGFLDSQRLGIETFRTIDPQQPLIVAESVWQYSHHVLAGLTTHQGPILTVANWSGQWPGLVGMLNLNGCLTKAGVTYSTLWSEDFTDAFFENLQYKFPICLYWFLAYLYLVLQDKWKLLVVSRLNEFQLNVV